MNNYTLFGAAAIVSVGLVKSLKTRNDLRRRRENLTHDFNIDIQAIRNAQAVMTQRIMNGYKYENAEHIAQQFTEELKFQRIALREN